MKLAISRDTFTRRNTWNQYRGRKREGPSTLRGRFYDYCEKLETAPSYSDLARLFGVSPGTAGDWCKELGVGRRDFEEIRYQRAVKALEGRTAPMTISEFNRVATKGKSTNAILKLLAQRRPDLRRLVVNQQEEAVRKRARLIREIIECNLSAFEIQERYGCSYSKATKLRYEALGNTDEKVDEEWRHVTFDNPEPWDKEYAEEIARMKYDGYKYAGETWKRYRELWGKKHLRSMEERI